MGCHSWQKNPFVSHAFLTALEIGGAVGGNSGWSAMHLLLRDEDGQLLGAMPHYLKHHSYGEYIFDHSWANAFERAGGAYYPKLLGAVPFTPASGPRLLVRDGRSDHKTALAKGHYACWTNINYPRHTSIFCPSMMPNYWPMMAGCTAPVSSSIGIIKILLILMRFWQAFHRGNGRIFVRNEHQLLRQG